MTSNSIKNNFFDIYKTIEQNAQNAGRKAADVTLVAISKRQPMERIREAVIEAGHRVFGENRVQEAKEHWTNLKAEYPDIKLHLVGPLQTNKTKDAVALFDVIETLDRPKLADALKTEMEKQGRKLPCFIQVNTGDEPQKSGVRVEDLTDFLFYCTKECGLDIAGLMCIPPADEPSAMHFALLSKLAQENGLAETSMGMSSDFEKAIPLGATYVRVGTALFGERD